MQNVRKNEEMLRRRKYGYCRVTGKRNHFVRQWLENISLHWNPTEGLQKPRLMGQLQGFRPVGGGGWGLASPTLLQALLLLLLSAQHSSDTVRPGVLLQHSSECSFWVVVGESNLCEKQNSGKEEGFSVSVYF